MKARIFRFARAISLLASVVSIGTTSFSFFCFSAYRESIVAEVPKPQVLKSQIRKAFERVESVGYTKTLVGYKANPDSGDLFQFTVERHSVVVKGDHYRTVANCYSREMVGKKCHFFRQESVFLQSESKDLLFKQFGQFDIPKTTTFDESLLSRKRDKTTTLSTQAILVTRGGHPLVEVPFLNGRFLTFEGRNVVGLMDDEMLIKNAIHEGLNCLEVTITRSNLNSVFIFCPQLNYSILKWRIEKFIDDSHTVVLKSTISNIRSGMTHFEIVDSYELLNKDGLRQEYQETHASFRDVRTVVDDSELERVYEIPEDTEVSIVGMPQIQAVWRKDAVVRVYDEKIIEAASTARLTSRRGYKNNDWKILGICFLGFGMLVALALINFWPSKILGRK